MLNILPPPILGVIASLLLCANVLFWVSLLLVFAIPKYLLPIPSLRRALNREIENHVERKLLTVPLLEAL